MDAGQHIRKAVGPDKMAAHAVLAQLENEIALAKIASQEWAGLDKVRQRRPPTFGEINTWKSAPILRTALKGVTGTS